MKKLLSLFLMFILLLGTLSLSATAADTKRAGLVSTAGGNLNIRTASSASASIIKSVKNGSYVTLVSKSGSFWRVEYAKDKYGYCHSDYIKALSSTQNKVKITSGSLNVRSGAGTNHSVIGSLNKGSPVLVLSVADSWSKILFNGSQIGFVSSKYLTADEAYSSVKLSVPSYKQTDSRWASVKIGSSGKTISLIGCATTAIAMLESYRSGKTIYPDAMSKKLTYSSSGNVYWPTDYSIITSSNGYFAKIYDLLKSNKPVLLGATTASGKQHWVVVTGFNGGDSLTPAAFTINDPGSKTRDTLQQFLNAYPNFYKMLYY